MRLGAVVRAVGGACLALAAAPPAHAQLAPIAQDTGANGLALALRRAGVTARVLYVTAHPDDEHNGMLVRLSRGMGVRTAVVSLTRGDGGQNEIGPELFEALGVARTEELAAVHRYDGAEQYFGHAFEFGYSMSVEETLDRWGREATLGDVVRVVRAFRPDVILTLPLQAPGGGQHHQVAARLALDAFRAAADPARFPEQVAAGLRPWQARKIYEGGTGGGDAPAGARRITVSTATWDPLLGASWQEFGSLARASHRTQGMSQLKVPAGVGQATYNLVDSEPPAAPGEAAVLDGVDGTLGGLLRFAPGHQAASPALAAALREVEARLEAARQAFDARAPERTLPSLEAALAGLRAAMAGLPQSTLSAAAKDELLPRLLDEADDVERALALAHGLSVESLAGDDLVVPGQSFEVTTRLVNQGASAVPVDDVSLRVTEGWTVRTLEGGPAALAPGASLVVKHEVTVPAGAPATQPYWRRNPRQDRFDLVDPRWTSLPWAPPDVTVAVAYRSGDTTAGLAAPVQWRYGSPTGGEKQKVVQVVPALTVRVEPSFTVVPIGAPAPRALRVAVASALATPTRAMVRVEAPAGWRAEPAQAEVTLRFEGEEAPVLFRLTPPASLPPGTFDARVVATAGGREYRESVQVVAYPHTQERRLYAPAVTRVLGLDVALGPGISVGYVSGPGDRTAEALRELGVPLTFLDADALAFGDLARFTTIVLGVRAFQTRDDLKASWARVMQFVADGGHVVVQYNKFEFNQLYEPPRAGGFSGSRRVQGDSPFAPYPASVTARRVTDELAPPVARAPASPLLNTPNRLDASDWEGWVQERGLYFLDVRDARYSDVLAFTDRYARPPVEEGGALVEAPVGKGTWTYVGLGLFRQLPAGVPGAYRLLANLVSRPRGR